MQKRPAPGAVPSRLAAYDHLDSVRDELRRLELVLQQKDQSLISARDEIVELQKQNKTVQEYAQRTNAEWQAVLDTNAKLVQLVENFAEVVPDTVKDELQETYEFIRSKYNEEAARRSTSNMSGLDFADVKTVAGDSSVAGVESASKRKKALDERGLGVLVEGHPQPQHVDDNSIYSSALSLGGAGASGTVTEQGGLSISQHGHGTAALASADVLGTLMSSDGVPLPRSGAAAAAAAPPLPQSSSGSSSRAPRTAHHLATFRCKDIVSSVAFSHSNPNHIFTGSKGVVALWNVESHEEPMRLVDYRAGYFIRCVRPLADRTTVVTAGESPQITLLDIGADGATTVKGSITGPFPSCYSVTAPASDPNLFFTSCSNGAVLMWDVRTTQAPVRDFKGHTEAVTCADIFSDGRKFFTGSLDRTVNCWDVGMNRSQSRFRFHSQVFALAVKPDEPARPQLAVGLDSEKLLVIDLIDQENNQQWELVFHTSSILSLKYARSGSWFMSTGKDRAVVAWRAPKGPSIFKASEPNSVLCCDVAPGDTHFVTGSGGRTANIYRLDYGL